MQLAIPEVISLDGETEATKKLYGFDAKDKHTQTYARECLIARRLIERGVRFVELTIPLARPERWDAHNDLVTNHSTNARAMDQPIAGLIRDLKSRGLLDETLVVWSGEFGRTPFAQGRKGPGSQRIRIQPLDGRGRNQTRSNPMAQPTNGATRRWIIHYRYTISTPLCLHQLGIDHEELTLPLQRS